MSTQQKYNVYQIWYKHPDKNAKSGWGPWRKAGSSLTTGRLDYHDALKVLADEMSSETYNPDWYQVRVTFECKTERGGHVVCYDRGPRADEYLDEYVYESRRERSYERDRYDD